MSDPVYVLIFVRKDLSPVQRVVQASHAALCSGDNFNLLDPHQTHILVFGVENEDELIAVKKQLTLHKIMNTIFYEPDKVDVRVPGYTALATAGYRKSELIDRGFSTEQYKLLTME